MHNLNAFQVSFIIRKKKIDPEYGQIFARIRVNGRGTEFSIKHEVFLKQWCNKSASVNGSSFHAQTVNNAIDQIKARLHKAHKELVDENKFITANLVQLDFQVVCSPFEILVTISNPDPDGTYNWSNGETGIHTTINHTGMLGVRYTNQWGCSVWKHIPIPALPEEHMWVFPTGCFETCEDPELNSSYVIGPLPVYDMYDWLWDASGNQASGQVPPQPINQQGALQLELGVDIYGTTCTLTSGTLQVTISHEGCRPCEGEIEAQMEAIDIGNAYPYSYYDVHMHISNPHGMPLTFQFTSPDGVYIPNNITVGAGQTVLHQMQFIPNAGFAGGNSLTFIQVLHNGNLFCYEEIEVEYPGITPNSITESQPHLKLVPNPANEMVNVHYDLNESNKGTLIVYNLLGVVIRQQPITQNSGVVSLDLGNISSGTYIVIINDDIGQRMQQVLIKK